MNISEWIRQVKQLIESPAETIAGFTVGCIFAALVTWRIAKAILARMLENEIRQLKDEIKDLKRNLEKKDTLLRSYISDFCSLKKDNRDLMGKWESTSIELGEALAKVDELEKQLTVNKREEPKQGPKPAQVTVLETASQPSPEAEPPTKPTLKLVTTQEEIAGNLQTIERYLSSNSKEDVAFAKRLLARGKCFVILRVGERIIAGPSRFIGYANNSRQKHSLPVNREILSGGDTNWAITNLLGDYQQSKDLDELFKRFCEKCNAEMSNKDDRKFWLMENVKTIPKGMRDPDDIIPPDKKFFEEPDLSPEEEQLLDHIQEVRVRKAEAGLDPYAS